MTLSVVCLIALQIYWINSMIKIETERFERTVNIALLNTAAKLEKREAASAVIKKITGGKNNVVVYVKSDSIPDEKNHKDNLPYRIIRFDSSHGNNFGYRISYSTDSLPTKQRVEIFENHASVSPKSSVNYTWNVKADTMIFRRNQLVQNVVTELTTADKERKIEDRLSTKLLDSLLSNEFRNSGINTGYYFGVDKTKNDSLTLVKEGADTARLRKSDLRTLLFPGEMFFNPNQLVVYFPNKGTYIFSSVAGMLVLSIALILIISGVFFKTVQMFVRQKKITEVKNDLINNITHEFKTPISTISIACEALNEPGLTKDTASVGKYSSIIKEENERLRMMVENILASAAFEVSPQNGNGSLHLSKENISLDEIINKALGKFEEALKQKNGEILFEGIPSGIIINADKFHFTNIISNLIDNAIKYNEQKPEIKVSVFRDSDSAVINISDNGIGIAKENLDKIFDTFYRVPTGNIHNVRGNGIGLSYVKKIVVEHGGSISVKSALGKGSTFEIKVPVSAEKL